jgi:dTDP-4-dehydrorhamnose 3,5-epimerase
VKTIKFRKIETSLPGVCILEPKVYEDARGHFMETYNQEDFAALGINDAFVQDNHSYSVEGTLRGLHYQLKKPQAKLCRVIEGAVLDVVADIRPDSPNFKTIVAVVLSAEEKNQLYVPAGYAHGFLAQRGPARFLYKCSAYYDQSDEYGVIWNDSALSIPWEIQNPLLSKKDSALPCLAQLLKEPEKLPS